MFSCPKEISEADIEQEYLSHIAFQDEDNIQDLANWFLESQPCNPYNPSQNVIKILTNRQYENFKRSKGHINKNTILNMLQCENLFMADKPIKEFNRLENVSQKLTKSLPSQKNWIEENKNSTFKHFFNNLPLHEKYVFYDSADGTGNLFGDIFNGRLGTENFYLYDDCNGFMIDRWHWYQKDTDYYKCILCNCNKCEKKKKKSYIVFYGDEPPLSVRKLRAKL